MNQLADLGWLRVLDDWTVPGSDLLCASPSDCSSLQRPRRPHKLTEDRERPLTG